jgi:biotin transporter BioY
VVLVAGGEVVAAEVLVAAACVAAEAVLVVGVGVGGVPASSAELTTLCIGTVIGRRRSLLSYSRTYPVASPGLRVTRDTAFA